MTCDTGLLGAGKKATVTVVGNVPDNATQSLVITAVLSPPVGYIDTTPGNNTTSITTPVNPQADLQLLKYATPTVFAGQTITYTLQVVNNGPSTAQSVSVVDTLPAGVTVNLPLHAGCTNNGNISCASVDFSDVHFESKVHFKW